MKFEKFLKQNIEVDVEADSEEQAIEECKNNAFLSDPEVTYEEVLEYKDFKANLEWKKPEDSVNFDEYMEKE